MQWIEQSLLDSLNDCKYYASVNASLKKKVFEIYTEAVDLVYAKKC